MFCWEPYICDYLLPMPLTRQVIKWLCTLSCFTLIANTLCAQEQKRDTVRKDTVPQRLLTLKGHVVGGKEKELLPGAYIYLGEDKMAVTTTDLRGAFAIPKLPAGKLQVSVSYIGYQTFSGIYELKEDLDIGEIQLQSVLLDEVIVQATPPLAVQRGDTTQFNAGAVKVAADADLEDLIKKLPGFEIVDGKIMAQGKEVTRLYIDGMEYSFNNPAAALKNLPAVLVARIKMYDDRSEEAKFSGFDDGEKYRSLNIETHDPNKKKIFGSGSAGYGITDPLKNTFKENNYRTNLSANLFDPKNKITFSGNANNSGQSNDLPEGRYKGKGGNDDSRMVYANVSSKLSEKLMFSGNYNFSRRNSYNASMSQQVYFPTDRYENRIYDRENHSWQNSYNQYFNMRAEYKLNEKNKITFSPTFSNGNNTSRSLSMGGNIENNDTINSSNTQSSTEGKSLQTAGDLVWMHAFKKKGRTFTARLSGSYNRNNSDQSQNNDERSLNDENVFTDTLRNLLIGNHRTGYNWSAWLTWSEPLSDHARIGVNYSYRENVDRSEQNSLSYADKEFQNLIGIDTAQTNQLKNTNQSHNYGVRYNYSAEKLSFNGGMTVNHTRMNNRYRYLGKADSLINSFYTDLSPMVTVNYKMNEKSNMDITYRGSSSSPNASQLQDILNVANPLQVSRGNPHLKKSYNHNIAFNYTRSMPEKSVFWYNDLTVGQTFNQISSNVKFIERDTVINDYTLVRGARLTTPVNLSGRWNMSARTNCSFPWKKLKLRFNTSLGYSFSHSPSIYDDLKNITDSHEASLRLNINTNWSEDFDLFVTSNSSYSYSRNTTTGGAQLFDQQVGAVMQWVFWKGFFTNVSFDGSYYINKKGEAVNQSENLLNLAIGKKFGKNRQMSVTLSSNDVLQARNSVNYSLNDLYSQTTYSIIPSSYFLLAVSYRFNNMNKNR